MEASIAKLYSSAALGRLINCAVHPFWSMHPNPPLADRRPSGESSPLRLCSQPRLSVENVQEETFDNRRDAVHFINFPISVWVGLPIEELVIVKE